MLGGSARVAGEDTWVAAIGLREDVWVAVVGAAGKCIWVAVLGVAVWLQFWGCLREGMWVAVSGLPVEGSGWQLQRKMLVCGHGGVRVFLRVVDNKSKTVFSVRSLAE